MAFQKAAGYNNLPNGVFSATVFSKKVQKQFRKSSVIEDITNNDYFGEINGRGDSVKIIKEPEISVREYARGTQTTSQELEDSDFTLIVDRANYFQFRVDDIEVMQSHVNWEDMASDRAAYRLKDKHETDVLGYLAGYEPKTTNGVTTWVPRTAPVGTKADVTAGPDELLARHKLARNAFVPGLSGADATKSIVTGVGGGGTYDATPLQILNRFSRMLDQQNVDKEGRWFVADPIFYELLADENSKFVNNDYAGDQDAGDILRNGRVVKGLIRGFRVYVSNNMPSQGLGADQQTAGGSNTDFGLLLAGHDSAVATATQMHKTETFRDTDSFGDIVRGMQLYGRKILRPEALIQARYNKV